jgi:hypothetical protein
MPEWSPARPPELTQKEYDAVDKTSWVQGYYEALEYCAEAEGAGFGDYDDALEAWEAREKKRLG